MIYLPVEDYQLSKTICTKGAAIETFFFSCKVKVILNSLIKQSFQNYERHFPYLTSRLFRYLLISQFLEPILILWVFH